MTNGDGLGRVLHSELPAIQRLSFLRRDCRRGAEEHKGGRPYVPGGGRRRAHRNPQWIRILKNGDLSPITLQLPQIFYAAWIYTILRIKFAGHLPPRSLIPRPSPPLRVSPPERRTPPLPGRRRETRGRGDEGGAVLDSAVGVPRRLGWVGVAKAIDLRKIGILSVRIDGELADRRPRPRASRADRRGDQDRRGGHGLNLSLSPESETNSDKIGTIEVALSFFTIALKSPSMDYLSSGFSKVDGSQNPDVFFSCLRTLCSLPYFQDCKKNSFQLLNTTKSSRILEVGCGLGGDASTMAEMIGGRGYVVAIDSSRKMIETASKASEKEGLVFYCLGDACRLPFRGSAFDGARADRVLQHIADPRKAFSEMVRVVRERGRLVVYEPDWGTFIINGGQREVSRAMAQLFGDTFPSGVIGRQLPGFFREERLENIQIRPETFTTDDLDLAVKVFDLINNAHRAEQMGYVSEIQADIWLEDLRKAHNHGRFFCSYTGFLVSGDKATRSSI